MILLDYSQVAISNLYQQLKYGKPETRYNSRSGAQDDSAPQQDQVQPELLRHMILNSIRKLNREFGQRYGQLVICTDNQNYWRKSAFKHYKANRKKDRDESGIDWPVVFQTLNELRHELHEVFPYKVLNVSMAEADDVIGVIAKHYHTQEKLLIISGDKDFMQLQVYQNVEQYNPAKDRFLKTEDPVRFLQEHIMRGDKGDGIPNFLSDDDVFVSGKRQSPVFNAKIDVWITQKPEEYCDERMLKNYDRNKMLVDLSQIPADVEAAIIEDFNKPIVGSKDKLFGYFIKHRMKYLMESIRDF